jgi:hypothetical protein
MNLRSSWVAETGQTREDTRITQIGATTMVSPVQVRSGILRGSYSGQYRLSGGGTRRASTPATASSASRSGRPSAVAPTPPSSTLRRPDAPAARGHHRPAHPDAAPDPGSVHRGHTRPALNEVTGGALTVKSPNDTARDAYNHELLSDDVTAGGLARPWLAILPPQDLASANWSQTTSTAWTTIARSFNPIWQPRMRLHMYTRVSSGATGQVKVLVDGVQWGSTVTAGTTFDHTATITADIATRFGTTVNVEIQAIVTSASGTVYAQPAMMYGLQS